MSLPANKDVPEDLKFIIPYLSRAREMISFDAVISYYCLLYAIQSILATNMHLKSKNAANFTANLLDTVEKEKIKLTGNELLEDGDAGSAYVESFATKIFSNADKQVLEHTSNKKTAHSFIAAANFFEVLKVFLDSDDDQNKEIDQDSASFKDLDSDIKDKIVYAKFQATRILKTLNSGGDPNEYTAEQFNESENVNNKHVNEKDQDDRQEDEQEYEDSSLKENSKNSLEVSLQDNTVVDLEKDSTSLPTVRHVTIEDVENTNQNNVNATQNNVNSTQNNVNSTQNNVNSTQNNVNSTQNNVNSTQNKINTVNNSEPSSISRGTPNSYSHSKDEIKKNIADNERYSLAQKHAKWAISALNYEDSNTAISELTKALAVLQR